MRKRGESRDSLLLRQGESERKSSKIELAFSDFSGTVVPWEGVGWSPLWVPQPHQRRTPGVPRARPSCGVGGDSATEGCLTLESLFRATFGLRFSGFVAEGGKYHRPRPRQRKDGRRSKKKTGNNCIHIRLFGEI